MLWRVGGAQGTCRIQQARTAKIQCTVQARIAAKEAREMFEKLADERMRAAALLVQSHICIKSKNQEKEKRAAEALKLLV